MFLKPHIPNCPFSDADIDAIIKNLLNNIATTSHSLTLLDKHAVIKAIPGVIIASPSLPSNQFSQSYFYHWVRDGAIVMASICYLYVDCKDVQKKAHYREIMLNYIDFVEKIQSQPDAHGISVLGEPKFNVDGTIWMEDWGRPQLGGTAIQALVLIRIMTLMEMEGEEEIVHKIYNADTKSLLKANLEYIARTWSMDSINVWEELSGNHFSVRMIQRIALLIGAKTAEHLEDPSAAKFYLDTANHITDLLRMHWREGLGYYFETMYKENFLGGGLDSSVLMVLFFSQVEPGGEEFLLTSTRALSTIFYIRSTFESLYRINMRHRMEGGRGVFLGRYQQDIYDGNQSDYGNPWFICTNMLACVYYNLIAQLLSGHEIKVNELVLQFLFQVAPTLKFKNNETINKDHKLFRDLLHNLFEEADGTLAFVKKYCVTYPDGTTMHMSEQIDRDTGEQVSALDLSWSYASLLSALQIRKRLVQAIEEKNHG